MPKLSPSDQFKLLHSEIKEVKHETNYIGIQLKSLENRVKILETDLADFRDEFTQQLFNWKSELFTKIDSFMGRIKSHDEEIQILSGRQSDHSDRLEKIESTLFPSTQ